MAEISPSSTEKTVFVTQVPLGRLWTLTIVSLVLNLLILLLIVVGAIIHHHRHGFAGQDGHRGGWGGNQCRMEPRHRFHHFGGMDMDQGERGPGDGNGGPHSFDDQGGKDRGGPAGAGPGGPPPGMPGMGGMHAMMGGAMGKPDPAKMSEMILGYLSTSLSLTDDQKAKIKPIVAQQVAEMQKQMEAQHAVMVKQMEDAKARIKPILTPDQQKQLDAMPLPGKRSPAQDAAPDPDQMPGQ